LLLLVSVLFSEPKIPQSWLERSVIPALRSFSALQRAENSSIAGRRSGVQRVTSFSALQRAENSSILDNTRYELMTREFQCSSASRKFLNPRRKIIYKQFLIRFQCSSASRKFLNPLDNTRYELMLRRFQCSSASRKFLNPSQSTTQRSAGIEFQCSSASRKFLNPGRGGHEMRMLQGFSALQRAENSSIPPSGCSRSSAICRFSALQRAENSSIHQRPTARTRRADVSVLFSEPKIPQSLERDVILDALPTFQCSSASRKFLNPPMHCVTRWSILGFSALQRAENSSI